MRYACLIYFDPQVFHQNPEAWAVLRDGHPYGLELQASGNLVESHALLRLGKQRRYPRARL